MEEKNKLKFCSRCVLNGSVQELILDSNGVCNFCFQALKALAEIEKEKPNFGKRIEQIKKDGQGKKYDVLCGISGGVDSSTALHHAVRLGLRPLCFSVDNGWNDPRADSNILNLVETLKVPFYRYTIDLRKFKELQAAFIKAGVPNIEIPTDAVLLATSLEMASKYRIRWIVSGGNVATEQYIPSSWGHNARDLAHTKAIYKQFIGKNLEGLPLCGLWKWNLYRWRDRIKNFYILDYLDYNRTESEKMLIEKYNFKSTGLKHEESVFTKWHINYYLYEKFGFDKRKCFYSSLINVGQMTREEAMELLKTPPIYPKLGIEQKIMKYPKREHSEFKTDKWYGRIAKIINLWKYTGIIRQV